MIEQLTLSRTTCCLTSFRLTFSSSKTYTRTLSLRECSNISTHRIRDRTTMLDQLKRRKSVDDRSLILFMYLSSGGFLYLFVCVFVYKSLSLFFFFFSLLLRCRLLLLFLIHAIDLSSTTRLTEND